MAVIGIISNLRVALFLLIQLQYILFTNPIVNEKLNIARVPRPFWLSLVHFVYSLHWHNYNDEIESISLLLLYIIHIDVRFSQSVRNFVITPPSVREHLLARNAPKEPMIASSLRFAHLYDVIIVKPRHHYNISGYLLVLNEVCKGKNEEWSITLKVWRALLVTLFLRLGSHLVMIFRLSFRIIVVSLTLLSSCLMFWLSYCIVIIWLFFLSICYMPFLTLCYSFYSFK